MPAQAKGSFEVKLSPIPPHDTSSPLIGRRSLDKKFQGALEATSVGEMVSAGTAVKGSAAYVAIETVSGVLDGRKGTFVLAHYGVLNRGAPQHHVVSVVPDSGTAELEGLEGTMKIVIEGGVHRYELEYTLVGAK